MIKRKDIVLIFTVCFFLGFIITKQFFLHQEVTKVSQPESGSTIAIEVAELIKSNDKLRKQITQSNEQLDKLNQSTADLQSLNEAVEEGMTNYKIILGLTDVSGKGVAVTFDREITSTQMIDLINAIKNIDGEAISINNKRVGPNTSIENGIFYPPTIVQVIGDPEILKDSLMRAGGIIDQLGSGGVEKKDDIYLKAI